MSRIQGSYIGKPGLNSNLATQGIESEGDWHAVFEERMEAAGWAVKHEVVANDGDQRADFLAYHDRLNRSYDDGEWVGFELKYSDYQNHTRAQQIAHQIEDKYLDASWLSSGDEVDLWVVAPYVKTSHSGDRDKMIAARNRELEAARFLTRMGFGYLNSWHPTPHMMFDKSRSDEAFPRFEEWASTPGVPAFEGVFDPWRHAHYCDFEAERLADVCRVKQSNDGIFDYDRAEMRDVFDEYRGGESDD